MQSKKVSDWFMKNIILPNNEVIDTPGYVAIEQFSKETGKFYLREVFLPEMLLAEVESAIAKKFGDAGIEAIYRAGKEWGHWFCSGSGLPTKNTLKKEEFLGFFESFMRLMEAEYATKVVYTADLDNDILTFNAENLMVCSHNSRGYFLLGAMTGAWAYYTERDDVEGSQPICQGKKGKVCSLVCGPYEKIKKNKGAIRAKMVKEPVGIDASYIQLNMMKKLPYAKNSLRNLLESGYVKYAGGFFHINGERLLLNEASYVYFIEKNAGRLKGGERLLFETALSHFSEHKEEKALKDGNVVDILPALGWGDIRPEKDAVMVYAYPYSWHYATCSFPLIRGMLSGLLSSPGARVRLKKAKTETNNGQLDIWLE